MTKTPRPHANLIVLLTLLIFASFSLYFQMEKQENSSLHEVSTEYSVEMNQQEKTVPSRNEDGDTFSIVAFDPNTGQVGGAGCSCVGFNGGIDFLNDLIVDGSGNILGGINSQAAYNASTQAIARNRMLAGDTPQEIMDFVVAADGGSASRQYGVVGFDGPNLTSAGFTGTSNGYYANHIGGTDPSTGITYSIQGNILDNNDFTNPTDTNGQDVLDDMETAFLEAEGTLADRIMAAMQGAKRVGGDTRCAGNANSPNNVNRANSGRTAFIRVLSTGDTDNSPSFSLNTDAISGQPTTSGVPNYTEPIDKLQSMYDDAVGTGFCRTTVSTFPYTMDFETTMWLKDDLDSDPNDDDRSWVRNRNATASGNTGPNSANQGTFYAYMEATDITGASDNAAIASPCFQIPSGNTAEITFDYHMFGAGIGTLALQANINDGNGWTTLWSLTDEQNNAATWNNDETVDLTGYAGSTVKLRFLGNRDTGSNDFRSDMAVDDINITITPTSPCSATTKTWNGTAWSPTGAPTDMDQVIINGAFDTATDGNIEACILTVNAGITLTVNCILIRGYTKKNLL